MKTQAEEDKADCIIVRCPDCNRLVYAAVNEPKVMDHKAFKDIGRMVTGGHVVEHMAVEDVRKSKFGCKCP